TSITGWTSACRFSTRRSSPDPRLQPAGTRTTEPDIMSAMNASSVAARNSADAPTKRDLFLGFLIVGLQGFGGVLPFARRMLVEERRWLDEREFTEVL